MKKFFTILVVTMLVVSCYQEYEVPLPQKDREVLSAPTRLDRNLNNFFLNDSLMVLGPQLENPYAVENMQQARAQLMEEDPSLNIPEITISHIYARFAPANDDELYTLLQDTTVHFFDFPLDREVISGVYYHDPAIADSLPTYQYVSIPIERWAMNYANSDISHEILEYLCIPEDDEDFWGGGDDGNITPNPGIGTITPIIPGPWIPAPDPGEDGPIGPNNITLSQEDITDMLVDRAMYLTGNLDSDSDTSTQSVAGTNSSSSRWTPSGRITAYDDIANAQIPLEGVKVWAHRWFTIREGYTDANGYFTCDGTLKGKANYYIKWERAYWDIREGIFGQAYYNEPSKISGEWNLSITPTTPKSLAYSAIHRAAHRFFYRNDTLSKPSFMKETIAYRHKASDKGISGKYWLELGDDIFPDIRIFGFSKQTGNRYTTAEIFNTTCHELGHAAHWSHSTWNFIDAGITGDLNFIESWAECVGYILTTIEYEELGISDSLHKPWQTTINENTIYESIVSGYIPNWCNIQYWILPICENDFSCADDTYTSVFIDLVDNLNQKIYTHNKNTIDSGFVLPQEVINRLPTDTLCYPLRQIESIVFDSASLNGVKNRLTGLFNPMVDSNAQEKVDALIAFFEQYQ